MVADQFHAGRVEGVVGVLHPLVDESLGELLGRRHQRAVGAAEEEVEGDGDVRRDTVARVLADPGQGFFQ